MTECSTHLILSPLGKKPVVIANDGGALSSDAGVLLVQRLDRRLGITRALAACLREWRQPGKVQHSLPELLQQRIYQLCLGYEDCNDADSLRTDPALKLALERTPSAADLASQATLSRLENSISARDCYRLSEALLECYVARHRLHPPTRLILDVDTTDDLTHGPQQGALFNTHYGGHCFLPLLFFAQHEEGGPQYLLGAVLRPGKAPSGRASMWLLRRFILRLQQAFPKCRIEVRADSGFASPEIYSGCEALGVDYTISVSKNSRLLALAEPWLQEAQARFAETGQTARVYGEVSYRARSWAHSQRVVVKAEWMAQGPNPRFVTTSRFDLDPESHYSFYCQRGDAENRIKELKEDLHADRLSCSRFLANQFRLLLHAAAYMLLQALQEALSGTELAAAQVGTLRLKLLKVGARVRESVRRVAVSLPSAYPYVRFWERLIRAGPA